MPKQSIVTLVLWACIVMMTLVPPQRCLARKLKDCSSEAISSASSYTKDAISEAVSKAFAECTSCPCTREATTAAEAISEAVARAMATTALTVKGTRTFTLQSVCCHTR